MNIKMQVVNCPICSFVNFSVLFKVEEMRVSRSKFRVVRCNNCGVLYINPRPDKQDIANFYQDDYFTKKKNRLAHYILNLIDLRKIARYMRRHHKYILDIGCGTGDLLVLFKQRGYLVCGVDVSPTAVKIALTKGLYAVLGELESLTLPEGYYDVIILREVIEHFHNPIEKLRRIRLLGRPDSIIFITTPNIDCVQFKIARSRWPDLDVPRHLCLFNRKSLQELLEKLGFVVVNFSRPSIITMSYDLALSLSSILIKKLRSYLRGIILLLFFPSLFICLMTQTTWLFCHDIIAIAKKAQ